MLPIDIAYICPQPFLRTSRGGNFPRHCFQEPLRAINPVKCASQSFEHLVSQAEFSRDDLDVGRSV
jgi:hypothetical protein